MEEEEDEEEERGGGAKCSFSILCFLVGRCNSSNSLLSSSSFGLFDNHIK
jgi:hypothetical protein